MQINIRSFSNFCINNLISNKKIEIINAYNVAQIDICITNINTYQYIIMQNNNIDYDLYLSKIISELLKKTIKIDTKIS